MPSPGENDLDRREQRLNLREDELNRRETALVELARELAAEHERLRSIRTDLLRRAGDLRRQQTGPRWPTGPRTEPALVSEDEWWTKMLGREAVAASR